MVTDNFNQSEKKLNFLTHSSSKLKNEQISKQINKKNLSHLKREKHMNVN